MSDMLASNDFLKIETLCERHRLPYVTIGDEEYLVFPMSLHLEILKETGGTGVLEPKHPVAKRLVENKKKLDGWLKRTRFKRI